MSLQIRKAIIDNVRVYFFPPYVPEDSKELDKIIDRHLNVCDSVLQYHVNNTLLTDIRRVIRESKKHRYIPVLVHVFPSEDPIISVYIKEH